jgi:acetyl esterase
VKPHPQVAALLEAAARSPLPTLDKVSAFVARRLYAERCRTVAPKNPPAIAARIVLADGVVVRAYRPSKEDVLPALVFFHGGGWTIGDLDTHDTLCRELAKGASCAVFSVEYRLAPESPFPAAVEDCIRATEWVAREAAALRIDSTRIAVGGDSAGGNLAAVVALHMPDRLCYQLLIYPATDQHLRAGSLTRNGQGYLLTLPLMERFRANYLPDPATYADWRASPALAKSFKGLPGTFILTAGFDPLLDEGREYAELLARDGVEVAYRSYEDMIHGFILMGGVLDTANAAVADCCAALRRAFDKVAA